MESKWDRISSSAEATALLKLFLRIDQLCDHEGDVNEFLPNLLHQLAQILDVQTVVVTIKESESQQRILGRYDRGESDLSDQELMHLANRTIESRKGTAEAPTDNRINNILAVPIVKTAKKLGALLLINKSTGDFGEYDRIVVTIVETRLDDVLDELIKREEQRRVSLENRVMKEIDKIRDESTDHGEALDQMIRTILDSVGAQIGFITLYDSERDRHLPAGKILRGSRPMSQDDYHQVGNLVRLSKDEHRTIIQEKLPNSEIDCILVVPMFITGLFLGSVVLINKGDGRPFSESDKQLVESVTRLIDSFIFQEEKFKRLMVLIGREATRDVEEALIGNRPDTALGQRTIITMLFADIRNYSQTTKDMDPSTAVRMLNDYFNAVTPLVASHYGIVDKYVGDELVALFTQSTPSGSHAYNAVEAALALQAELKRLNREWELTGRPIIQIGIGIHTGEVVLGQIGSYDRKDYTAIGANMNFASRLQSIAGPGEIMISEATYVGLTGRAMARRVGPYSIKGFGEIMAYRVEGRSPEQF
ncbi:MAG TPA: adenylate/guanylate cyclase domain-containing protein [bacterium]|nr:adenylate/guanylate cyclase domain-containing protein [bacterium]HNT65698.1 adenylate/guanylate cyclase domain-containing protein [bacterium]HOX84857.1 adenylate/guanylate cyclase domain-containing protein [bacterium]HPG44277.1 adenylate/guanylate cyclase domain-containing protein [bacterium]HPM96644.1 adenylate/guanylate cyclase domain-containing protein [bacterium]